MTRTMSKDSAIEQLQRMGIHDHKFTACLQCRHTLSRALGADLQITFVVDRDPLTRGWGRIADHLRAAGSGENLPLLDRVRVADAVRARSAALWSSRLTPWFTSRGMMDLSCSKYSGSRRRRREGKKRNSIRSSKDRRLEGRETRIVKNPLSLTVRSTQTVK
jgi:hypothetical protein